MPVFVRPLGVLKTYVHNQAEVSVEPGQSARQAMTALGIPSEVVALVMVNGEAQDKDYLLQEGDVVKLVAIIGGG